MSYDRSIETKDALLTAALDGVKKALELLEDDGWDVRLEFIHCTGTEPIVNRARFKIMDESLATPPPVPDNVVDFKEGA